LFSPEVTVQSDLNSAGMTGKSVGSPGFFASLQGSGGKKKEEFVEPQSVSMKKSPFNALVDQRLYESSVIGLGQSQQ
jgi:hypothetical protein